MPFTIIKGTYHVVGYSPDGDSIRFQADEEVILPKLFRRIVSFMGDGGGIDGFKDYLAANPDPVLELKTGHFTNLDTFVEVTEKKVKLHVAPEDLVFVEK